MGELSWLKGTQLNTHCSGFVSKNPLMGVLAFFSTGTYAGIGTKCVSSKIYYEKYAKNMKHGPGPDRQLNS